jgi:EAL domain-containing protein (putative c-di-GMP-specific phosphodiesterase class I)
VVGAEALVRWRHPVRGTIPPSEFLALAEETGDIIPIGDWVIARSCRLARSWQMVGGHGAVNMVSVNLSTRQLENGAIEQTVADALSESRLDPSALVLEISAGDAVPSDLIIDRLHAFHEMGARLALDDFGRGASLLAARMLPFDIVKLDRQMTSDVVGPQSDRVFAEALLSIGRARNLETVAKGVETREQARHLQAMGCDLAQGYLYSKPLGSEGISALLARARR